MRREQFVNNASTTLSSGITNSQTSITVADGTVFPVDGDFRIIIDSEIILVTARSGNTLTVVRGYESTTAVSHSISADVDAILTAGALEQYQKENTWHGNTAPPLRIFDLDTGDFGEVADFVWVNQGTSTAVDRNGRIVMDILKASGTQVRGLFQVAPTPPYSIICAFRLLTKAQDFSQAGLAFRESGTGKLHEVVRHSQAHVEIARHTNPTTFDSNNLFTLWGWGGGLTWFKIEDDNSNTKFYTSPNGIDWILLHSNSRTAFMVGGPDEVGIIANPAGANSFNIMVEVLHFGEE